MNRKLFDGQSIKTFTCVSTGETKSASHETGIEIRLIADSNDHGTDWYVVTLMIKEGMWYEASRYNYKYVTGVIWDTPIPVSTTRY